MRSEGVPIFAHVSAWPQAHPPAARGRPFRWLNRPRRVLLVLAAMWVLNLFDLGFTMIEAGRSHFHELNPVAARFLAKPSYVLAAYKAVLVGLGSAILLGLARRRIAELTAWLLLGVYILVAIRWSLYYKNLSHAPPDPTVQLIVRVERTPLLP